ncbi:MAG: type II toxin-antitoxin system VapC family toxin [Treponema sp.]|nr:type II toxin-antitoxin system VapC family toxin [Treponema sp.]
MRQNDVLLDTHIILWAMTKDVKLNTKMRDIILNPNNRIFYSIASMWEVQIKYARKKLPISGVEFMHYCEQSGYHKLPVDDLHVVELANLVRDESAPPHNDPFDKIMLSQAKAEGFTFLTHDPFFRGYNEPCVVEA